MDFASRISVICFTASYAVSMGAELLRFVWPTRLVRWVATGAALAGLTAHTLYLMNRGLSDGRLPISNQFESLICVSWLIALVYLYLTIRDRRLSAGIFVLPVSLILIGVATLLPKSTAANIDAGTSIIITAHGLFFLVGTVVVVIASAVSIMYLVKLRQLRRGIFAGAVRLPSLERLDRMNQVSIYIAWPLLTMGLAIGLMLQKLRFDDPKVVSTLVAWLILTILAHYRYRPEHRGQRVAILTIIAGAAVLVSFLGDPIFGTAHFQTPPREEARS
ncbi:cytochrome c biogenesis protein [bacterium]|nr:cytochrome c biogenesis protein [bacterium]